MGFEFILLPGQLALIPEGWAHAVHNLDDTAALTLNFVDEARLRCHRTRTRTLTPILTLTLTLTLTPTPPSPPSSPSPSHSPSRAPSPQANLRCHLDLLRLAAGQKLRRLFYTHQATPSSTPSP